MSDYFSRLADRALGRAEVLAPRVPYRFETGLPPVSAAPSDGSGEEASSDLENSSPLSKPVSEISPPLRVNQPSVSTLPRLQEPTRNGPGRTSAAAPQVGSPQATHELQRRQRPPAPVTAPPADNLSEPKPQSVLSPPLTQRNERRTSQVTAPKEKAQTSRREEVHPRIELYPTKIGQPPDAPISPAPEPRSEPTPARQPVPSAPKIRRAFHAEADRRIPILHPRKKDEHAPGPPAKFSSPSRRAEPPAEPPIKVTIGRVEVRAVMEAPKPAARPRKPVRSAISLDDFLKRHEERRR
jgi:hypothetical protein